MLSIHDLPESTALDSEALSAVSGGYSLSDLGPFANVNVTIDQDIAQFQDIEVNALNNIGVLGADLGPLNLEVSPSQWATAYAGFSRRQSGHSVATE